MAVARLTAGHELEKLCSPAIWAEGPVWLPQQEAVLFSDVRGNQMFCWRRTGHLNLWRTPAHYANGNACDLEGRLITCEHGRRGISRTEHDGTVTLLVESFEGKRFNSPNDVVVRSDGTIWFTDPPYGIINNQEGYQAESQIVGCYVYCFDPKEDKVHLVAWDVQRPNGLAFSPDERWLYVADMSVADFPHTGRRHLRIYPVEGLSLGAGCDFAEVSPGFPDGFCVDDTGRIFCSCADGVVIFSPQAAYLGKILLPERVSNCTLGGPQRDELYITATTSLYRQRLTI